MCQAEVTSKTFGFAEVEDEVEDDNGSSFFGRAVVPSTAVGSRECTGEACFGGKVAKQRRSRPQGPANADHTEMSCYSH